MHSHNPFWPKHHCVFKGFGDIVNVKMYTNPIGNLLDTFHDLKGGPNGILDALHEQTILGPALRPANINRYVKAGMNPYGQAYGYPGLEGNDSEGHPIVKRTTVNAQPLGTSGASQIGMVKQTGQRLPDAVLASVLTQGDAYQTDNRLSSIQ